MIMSLPQRPEWMTDELLRAEARLEEASFALEAELARADELAERIDSAQEPVPSEEVERFAAMCTTGAQVTPEWRAVAERVSRGEFTWRDVVEGRCDMDQGVKDAMASMRPSNAEVSLQSATAEAAEILEPGLADAGGYEFHEDDDYFSGGGFLR